VIVAERAPAKINLFLHVGDRRSDGYHALQSLVAFTKAGDELRLEPADDVHLTIAGPFARGLSAGDETLRGRAARALQSCTGLERGAAISLTKNLPVASGIGGGSSDCAATLRGLAKLWGAKITNEELCETGATLGSDVPVCIAVRPQFMEGRGEQVTALSSLPEMPIVLVNPGTGVPTSKVFAAIKQRRGVDLPLPPAFHGPSDLVAYLRDTANDLEAPAREVAPEIGEVLNRIAGRGALLTRMSGSGATCFGLFESQESANMAAAEIAVQRPNWWVVPSTLAPLHPT
jgi:4-diphosphocytidyl-2-C-methyl-D-erythritol kinase